MDTTPTIADLMLRAPKLLIGRKRELTLLADLFAERGPAVAYVYGPHGSGKSALLGEFARLATERSVRCLQFPGASIEPTPPALLAAIAAAIGCPDIELDAIASHLSSAGPILIVLDDVDRLQLLASWLRQTLVPRLPTSVRLVLGGRLPPTELWAQEYGAVFRAVVLGPLRREEVLSALKDLAPGEAEFVWRTSAGQPYALSIALEMARSGRLERAETLAELAEAVVASANSPGLSRLVEVAAVQRRVTPSLLTGVAGEEAAASLAAFAELPFVELDSEGYFLAEPLRSALAARQRALHPSRHSELRRSVASQITEHLRRASSAERWRHMADLMFLIEQPQIRDAFFPPDTPSLPVEPAEASDFEAILDIAERRAGPEEATLLRQWVAALPHRFAVARGPRREVAGFYVVAHGSDPLNPITDDSLLSTWRKHLADAPVRGQTLFIRQMLADDDNPDGPAFAACMLDVKRHYLELWSLSRVYSITQADRLASPVLRRLGFRPLAELGNETMVLDLPGTGLADWISGLLGVGSARAGEDLVLARDRRELWVDGRVVRLTKLEAGVLEVLIDNAPAVVSRDALIESVWRRAFVGSNVVDVVIRTLRQKLGSIRQRIETVPKSGYRYRDALPD